MKNSNSNFPEVLTSKEVEDIAIKNGWATRFVEKSEATKAKIAENFQVEYYEKIHGQITIHLQVAKFNGENIVAYMKASNGRQMFIYGENIEKAIQQAK